MGRMLRQEEKEEVVDGGEGGVKGKLDLIVKL